MATYKELLAQQKDLETQLKAAHAAEKNSAIEQARAVIAEYGLVEVDVFGRSISRGGVNKRAGVPIPAKYKDPETAKTWTGRGKPPSWIAGRDREPFLIK